MAQRLRAIDEDIYQDVFGGDNPVQEGEQGEPMALDNDLSDLRSEDLRSLPGSYYDMIPRERLNDFSESESDSA